MKTEIIYGFHPVFEALQAARRKFVELYVIGGRASERLNNVLVLAESRKIPVKRVQPYQLKDATGTHQHQGIGAKVSPYPLMDIAFIADKLGSRDQKRFLVLLDNILDPQNLGAIIRTALAVGVDGVITPKDRAAPPTPAVSKASAGALEHVHMARVTNTAETIKMLKQKGIWIFGMEKTARQSIFSVDLTDAVAVVIGGEEKGIRPLVKRHCDCLISIPQMGPIDSLNASAAAAVAMYEVFRQRTN
jgi:23S rRNA (guanosine2251-2'-O)-methyltransferase